METRNVEISRTESYCFGRDYRGTYCATITETVQTLAGPYEKAVAHEYGFTDIASARQWAGAELARLMKG